MKNKIFSYIIIGLLIAIVIQFFYYKSVNSSLTQDNLDLETEKQDELKQVRDSALIKAKQKATLSDKRFDSVVNIPLKIKYIPYEKPIYIDRTLDDALDIHTEYKSDTRTK